MVSLNRLKGVFSCAPLLGCCTVSVQGVWAAIGPVLYRHLACAFADRLKQLMCFAVHTPVQDGCGFTNKLQNLSLYAFAGLSCALLQEVCMRPSTGTAASLLWKFAQVDTLPSPPLRAARGQEATPATAGQLQTRATILQEVWGQTPRFKTASAPTEKSIFSHKTRRGMVGNHSLNKRVSVLS